MQVLRALRRLDDRVLGPERVAWTSRVGPLTPLVARRRAAVRVSAASCAAAACTAVLGTALRDLTVALTVLLVLPLGLVIVTVLSRRASSQQVAARVLDRRAVRAPDGVPREPAPGGAVVAGAVLLPLVAGVLAAVGWMPIGPLAVLCTWPVLLHAQARAARTWEICHARLLLVAARPGLRRSGIWWVPSGPSS